MIRFALVVASVLGFELTNGRPLSMEVPHTVPGLGLSSVAKILSGCLGSSAVPLPMSGKRR